MTNALIPEEEQREHRAGERILVDGGGKRLPGPRPRFTPTSRDLRPLRKDPMQISTAISDAVLAIASFWVARLVWIAGARPGAIGLALVGLAAVFGALRFSVAPSVVEAHSFCSALAGQVGIPLVALSFLLLLRTSPPGQLPALVFVGLVAFFLLFRWTFPLALYGTIIGGLAALVIVGVGLYFLPQKGAILAIVGALVLVGAGLGIGTKGDLLGIPRVDIFHYFTAVSVVLLGMGLSRISA